MSLRLIFLRQTALDMLRRDILENYDFYTRNEIWLDEYFLKRDISNYCFDSGIEVGDFELILGGSETDAQNAISVYDAFRGKINRLQATDFRLWVYLTHTTGLLYMKSRWELKKEKKDAWKGRINDRYFNATRSSYVRNGISRLYWSAELTYDEENSNPYEYLEYALKWQDLAVGTLERQIGRAKSSILGNLQALKESDLNEDDRRLFFTKINQYGGVKLLDSLSRQQSLDVSRRYIDYIRSLPMVENGKEILVKNTENGIVMKYGIEKGKLAQGKKLIKTTDRLLRRRKGSIIKIDDKNWQIVEIR